MRLLIGAIPLLAPAGVFAVAGLGPGAKIVLIGALAVFCSVLAVFALLLAISALWPLRRRCMTATAILSPWSSAFPAACWLARRLRPEEPTGRFGADSVHRAFRLAYPASGYPGKESPCRWHENEIQIVELFR